MAEGASHVVDETAASRLHSRRQICCDGAKRFFSILHTMNLFAVTTRRPWSFRNVVVFNAYEYYPLQKDSSLRTINQLEGSFPQSWDVAGAEHLYTGWFCGTGCRTGQLPSL